MPMIQVQAELYLEHKGVRVYHTYDYEGRAAPQVFTTDPTQDDANSLHPAIFQVYPQSSRRPALISQANAKLRGMELIEYRRTPEYLTAIEQWEEWFDVTYPALIREAVIDLIEKGKIMNN